MNTSTLDLQLNRSPQNTGEAYLKLQLDDRNHAALPIEFAQEVLIVPASRLTYMPNASVYMLGLLNQRSRVFWVADLPRMLGLEPIATDVHLYNIAIIQVQKAALALAVQAVKGVQRLNRDLIQSPIGTVSSDLTSYLQGCIPQNREVLLVLDPEAIVNASVLR
jgi:twitching motility protein PilI